MENVWKELQDFHSTSPLTAGSRESEREQELVYNFIYAVPLPAVFACLDAATNQSEHSSESQSSRSAPSTLTALVIACLKRVFQSACGQELLSSAETMPFLVLGLRHQDEFVRLFTIQTISESIRSLPSPEASVQAMKSHILQTLTASQDLLSAISDLIHDSRTAISDAAAAVLTALAVFETQQPQTLITSACLHVIANKLEALFRSADKESEHVSSIAMRFYDVVVKITISSSQAFQSVCSTPIGQAGLAESRKPQFLLDPLHDILNGSDVLLQLNVLDLYNSLSTTYDGVRYLLTSGIISKVLDLATDFQDSGTGTLLAGPALTLVAAVNTSAAKYGAEFWTDAEEATVQRFLRCAMKLLEMEVSGATPQIISAMDAVSAFAASSIGAFDRVMRDIALVRAWLEFASVASTELRSNCLHSVARVLAAGSGLRKVLHANVIDADTLQSHTPTSAHAHTHGGAYHSDNDTAGSTASPSPILEHMRERFFNLLGKYNAKQSSLVVIMDAFRKPFPELRNAAFDILRSLAVQPSGWGVRLLWSHGGCFDFLLDASTELTKETKEWKFSVIDALVGCPASMRTLSDLDRKLRDRVEARFREGPFTQGRALYRIDLDAA